ncbi:MAG: VCBS repeat-containing protein [Gemmatimonadota bacterium]|nr:MAG: VCBS repeat-containing protein [Gemmatimonadota bacterium]
MNRVQNLFLITVLMLTPLSQVLGSFFDRTTLKTEGKIVDGAVEDLNDDGLLDVLAVYATERHPHTRRWLAVFWQQGKRLFDPEPNQIWEVDPGAAILDIGDISSDPGREIVLMSGDGIHFYGQKNGAFVDEYRKVIETTTIFCLGEDDDLPTWNFARDICRNVGDEILIPKFGAIELWSRGEDGAYRLTQTFPVKMPTRVSAETPGDNYSYAMRADYRVPKIECKDFNNDGSTDVLVCWEDNLNVFLQNRDGAFRSSPDHEFQLELRTDDELENDEVELLLSVDDLNGDGYMDIVVNKMKGGLANAKTETNFYMAHGGNTFRQTPDHFMTADDAISQPYLVDLDGDNRLDLIQPEIKMGIKSVVSMLLMKKFNISFLVYLNREEGLFSEEPDFSTKVSFKLDFTRRGGTASPLIEFEGDYNGDGRKDLAVGTAEEELSVFFGDRHKVFTNKPQVVEKVRTSSHAVAKDFDGDGKVELLLYYPDQNELKNRMVLLWPK